jgi:hypothetical protein
MKRSLFAPAIATLVASCLALGGCTIAATDLEPKPDTVLVCHKGRKTLEIPQAAVDAHRAHGDSIGPCR